MPPQAWSKRASTFLAECQQDFDRDLGCDAAMALLFAERFLTPYTCLRCGIGWNDRERYEYREAWGLPSENKLAKLRLPRGIVIAIRRRNFGVAALAVRRTNEDIAADGDAKYWQIAGGAPNLAFVVGNFGMPVVLVESALDAVLVWQESRETVAAVATMGSAKALDPKTVAFVEAAPVVIIGYDDDNPGRLGALALKEIFPSALLFPPVDAKDLGDMHKKAMRSLDPDSVTLPVWLQLAFEATSLAERNQPL